MLFLPKNASFQLKGASASGCSTYKKCFRGPGSTFFYAIDSKKVSLIKPGHVLLFPVLLLYR